MSTILVVGGSGFIGSYLVERLIDAGHAVVVLDTKPAPRRYSPRRYFTFLGNSAEPRIVRTIFEQCKVETVYYLAWTSIAEVATRNPAADLSANVIPALSFLDACIAAGVKRVIFTSSGGAVYGIPKRLPISEDDPTNPINAYGAAKLAMEKYLQVYHHLYGLEYVIARPSVPYGPGQDLKRKQGAIVHFIDHALKGEPIPIFGADTVRDYFHVSDLAAALVSMATCEPNTVFNVGGGRGYSLIDIGKMVGEAVGWDVVFDSRPPRAIDPPAIVLSAARAMSYFQWWPKIEIRDGIRETVEWLKGLPLADRASV